VVTETLLIATDGSRASLEAVEVGVQLARDRGARVTFVHSSPEIAETLFRRNPLTVPTSAEVAAADPVLAAALARATAAGVEADLAVLGEHGTGDVAAAIVGAAQGVHASLVVVGARGRGALTESVVGSVSRSIMEASTITVVVVHAGAATAGAA
jgi:nucleotide-binding universal stress UspA family protein